MRKQLLYPQSHVVGRRKVLSPRKQKQLLRQDHSEDFPLPVVLIQKSKDHVIAFVHLRFLQARFTRCVISKMASILSRKAKLQVVDFLNGHHIDRLAKDWQGIYRTYHSESPARRQVLPLPEYVLSREFDACCDAYLSEESLSYLFSDGPPAVLWYALPKRIISSVVQVRPEYSSIKTDHLAFFLGFSNAGKISVTNFCL